MASSPATCRRRRWRTGVDGVASMTLSAMVCTQRVNGVRAGGRRRRDHSGGAWPNLHGGGEEHGVLWWPARRDDGGARHNRMTAERSPRRSSRCWKQTRRHTGSGVVAYP
jgi:hypothetical protein